MARELPHPSKSWPCTSERQLSGTRIAEGASTLALTTRRGLGVRKTANLWAQESGALMPMGACATILHGTGRTRGVLAARPARKAAFDMSLTALIVFGVVILDKPSGGLSTTTQTWSAVICSEMTSLRPRESWAYRDFAYAGGTISPFGKRSFREVSLIAFLWHAPCPIWCGNRQRQNRP